ncbi:MAG: hypothetical protein K0Q95_420 [Bacteroidota bacterium]|jgi:hypothetical protein|nr:hypothetical protein [Bacteroidota bacterium]
MVNNTPESKLDETVKKTLSEYEASYDAADWSRMEAMLDAAPKPAFSFKMSYALYALAGVLVIGGGYALINNIKNRKSDTPVSTSTPVVVPQKDIVKETPKTKTVVPPPIQNVLPPATETKETVISSPEPAKETRTITTETKTEKTPVKTDKPKTKKQTNEPIIEPHDKIIIMGNEPVFGDMLDSSKGIVGETKEKEEIKKAAKAKKETPVGWNQIMTPHMNIDSMRKARQQRDSLKNQ